MYILEGPTNWKFCVSDFDGLMNDPSTVLLLSLGFCLKSHTDFSTSGKTVEKT